MQENKEKEEGGDDLFAQGLCLGHISPVFASAGISLPIPSGAAMRLILGDDDEAAKSRSFVSSKCPAGTGTVAIGISSRVSYRH